MLGVARYLAFTAMKSELKALQAASLSASGQGTHEGPQAHKESNVDLPFSSAVRVLSRSSGAGQRLSGQA